MTDNPFAEKSAESAAQEIFMQILYATAVKNIPEASFAALKALPPGRREEAAAALEDLLLKALFNTAFNEQQRPMRELPKEEIDSIERGGANQAITQGIYRALVMVADIRGAGAKLMTTSYLQEVARLPAEQAGTVQGYAEAASRAWSHVVEIEYPDEKKQKN